MLHGRSILTHLSKVIVPFDEIALRFSCAKGLDSVDAIFRCSSGRESGQEMKFGLRKSRCHSNTKPQNLSNH